MAEEHFFPGPGYFSSGLGAAPFFGTPYAATPAAAFGVLPWADLPPLPAAADSSAATTAHFDSALSSLVSSPAHGSGGGVGDDVAIGDLIGRLGSICSAAAASASNSCYSTPLSSPPRGAPPAAALALRGGYPSGAPALETGRLSRVSSSKSLGGAAAPAATPPALESSEVEASRPKTGSNAETLDPAPAKGDAGAARKRKAASAKGKGSSSAMTAATNASPKRSKVATDGGDKGNKDDDEAAATAAAEEKKAAAPEPGKDYIHVRARRGQATDSHSLAERVRRERISERMKMLQSLVPGCNKITGKALMLDEIINYVQSLQRQVEFLSMKLATMNPQLDLDAHYLAPSDKDMTQQVSMLAYASSDPPAAAFSYADPFAAAAAIHPTCTSSFHPGGVVGFSWDLQSIVRHNMESAHDQQLPSPSAPHPRDDGFYGQWRQAAATVDHMKAEP